MYDLSNMGNKNALQRGNEKMKMIKKMLLPLKFKLMTFELESHCQQQEILFQIWEACLLHCFCV